MKKLFFALILTFAIFATSGAQIITGPSTGDAGTYLKFEIFNPTPSWDIWVNGATTVSYYIVDDDGMDITIEPTTGGVLKISGMNGGSPCFLKTCTVKPIDPVISSADANLTLVDHGAPHGEYVFGNYPIAISPGRTITDYDCVISGPVTPQKITWSAVYVRYLFTVAGQYELSYRYEQNGVWSDWDYQTITVNNP